MKSVQRAITAAISVVAVGGLTACGGTERSVQAYCETMDTHKDRYLQAMEVANTQAGEGDLEGLLSGLAGGMSALGDLAQMWEDLAEVAPEEIQADVETVRDSYQQQLDDAGENAGDPLSAFASSLASGLLSAGSWERVDQWTAENCGGDAVLAAEAPPTEAGDTGDATGTPEPPPAGPGIDQPITLNGEWRVIGDTLLSANDKGLFIPGQGEMIEFEVGALLPGEDVASDEVTVVGRGDDTLVVVAALIRTPAEGLNPESFEFRLITIDPFEWQIVSDTPFPPDAGLLVEDSNQLDVYLTGSPDGVVLISRLNAYLTVAVDARTGEELWRAERSAMLGIDAQLSQVFMREASGKVSDVDVECEAFSIVDVTTGEETWRHDELTAEGECPRASEPIGERYVTIELDEDESFTVDTTTGTTLTRPLSQSDYADPVSDLIVSVRDAMYYDDPGITFFDAKTGETFVSLNEETVSDLQLQIQAVYDGKVYVYTTDGQPVIDARTGDPVGEDWTMYTVGMIADWVVVKADQGYMAAPTTG